MITIAVVGAGHWGPNLIRNFHNHPRARWLDRRPRPAAPGPGPLPFPDVPVTAEVEAALADPSVDAVVISTPTITHYALAKAALEPGKHVLVEKPITPRRQGEELCRLPRAAAVLLVGHMFLYNAGVRRVKRYLDAGELGRVYYVSMVRTNLGPIRIDVNAAWDLAAHDIAIVDYWLGGSRAQRPAVGGTWINPGIEDAVFATLRYPDGVLVNLHASWLNPRKAREITVVGERRMLTFDDMNLQEPLRIYDKQVTGAPAPRRRRHLRLLPRQRARRRHHHPARVPGRAAQGECDHFLECIATGRQPDHRGRGGAAVVRALEAITRSMRATVGGAGLRRTGFRWSISRPSTGRSPTR